MDATVKLDGAVALIVLATSGIGINGCGEDRNFRSGASGGHGGVSTNSSAAGGVSGAGRSSGGRSANRGGGDSTENGGSFGGGTEVDAGAPNGGTHSGGSTAEPSAGAATTPDACSPSCSGDTPLCENGACVACLTGTSPRCSSDGRPEFCSAGAWVPQERCFGAEAACSVGKCAQPVLVGGIVSVTQSQGRGATLIRDQTFELAAPQCTRVGAGTVCVTGNLLP